MSIYSSINAQTNNSEDSSLVIEFPKSELYILNSIGNYKKTHKYKMDEDDCYLQIDGQYAVLSYIARRDNTFESGTIHNPVLKSIDGNSVTVFTIHTDNRFPSSKAGKRIFIGIPENFTENNTIFLMDNRKEPIVTLWAHIASLEEKNQLIKRSKEQAQ